MLETMVRNGIFFYVMGGLMFLGVIAKLVSHFTTRKMVKEAGEIHKSNHKLLKLVKAKFEHASMISDRVQNVEAFVDKYIYEYRIMGIRLYAWRGFAKKILWVILAIGLFDIFESYRMDGFGELFLSSIRITGILVMVLFLLCFITEEQTRLQAAKNYMVEYLENVCVRRYEKQAEAMPEPEEEPVVVPEKEAEKDEDIEVQFSEILEETPKEPEKTEQEMRIRAILEEFLA